MPLCMVWVLVGGGKWLQSDVAETQPRREALPQRLPSLQARHLPVWTRAMVRATL
jgi:hypothetical protein